jgi:hypothetical protein
MRNYIAVVFDDAAKAYKGLHALWQLDHAAEITIHGSAVIHRDYLGQIRVDTKETHPILGTAVGVGIGALLGALAGPVVPPAERPSALRPEVSPVQPSTSTARTRVIKLPTRSGLSSTTANLPSSPT